MGIACYNLTTYNREIEISLTTVCYKLHLLKCQRTKAVWRIGANPALNCDAESITELWDVNRENEINSNLFHPALQARPASLCRRQPRRKP